MLAPQQARFVSTLAALTGLNPRVVGAWALAEESDTAAKNYEHKGYNDWLNIANTDSGPKGGAHSSVWANPETAARATAHWLQGHGQLTHEYGEAAPGVRAILHTAHLGPTSQISAIAHSGWASSGYNGGSVLQQLYGEIGGHELPAPGAEALTPEVPHSAHSILSKTFDSAGYAEAQKKALANRLLTEGEGGSILRGLLPTSVTPGAFEHKTSTPAPTAHASRAAVDHPQAPEGNGPGPAKAGYPLAKHGKVIGTPYVGTHTQFGNWESDNAIDIAIPKGTPIYATESGTIGSQIGPLNTSSPQLAGERLHLDGGNSWYYAHLSRIVVHAGQHVRAGQLLGYSGEANGVQHLHIAAQHGNPEHLIPGG